MERCRRTCGDGGKRRFLWAHVYRDWADTLDEYCGCSNGGAKPHLLDWHCCCLSDEPDGRREPCMGAGGQHTRQFRLGLGSQVRAHIERRYGMEFDPPVTCAIICTGASDARYVQK